MEELKPCPFCGSDDLRLVKTISTGRYISVECMARKEAIKAWNRRVNMISWRDKEPTQKQIDLIEEMQEFSDFSLPAFKGTTRGEAHDWIQQNWKAAHESSWAIEHGYE